MIETITPATVRSLLILRQEIALFDVRGEAVFAVGHPLFASQLSVDRIETEIFELVPRKLTKIVFYDDGEGLAQLAAEQVKRFGYKNLAILQGGLTAWKVEGYEIFQDVNSYCKAFGELVEYRKHTPSLSAQEVQNLIDTDADIAILDARRFEEYKTMNIPGSTSVPGGELVLRAENVAPSADTTVIVNCAGRTRSIIGTQSLINAGFPRRIFALRNGTIGWALAGQTLEHGQTRRAGCPLREEVEDVCRRARHVAYSAGVRYLTPAQVEDVASDSARTLYRFDVRSSEEYLKGHITGFRNVEGGQLVQETDMYAPVRGARILLADDIGPRANMTASWLAQMGWEVYVLEGGFDQNLSFGPWHYSVPTRPLVNYIYLGDLATELRSPGTILIDLSKSSQFRKGHIPGAHFALRSELRAAVSRAGATRAILVSPDGVLAEFAAHDVVGEYEVYVLKGGTRAWVKAGKGLEEGFENALSEPSDVYKRPYEGTDNAAEAMQAYLDWEAGLVDQLERDGTHGFYVV